MATTTNVNKAIMVEINSDEDLRQWSIAGADGLRKLADDLELVEAQLAGKLRKMKTVDGSSPNGRARNVVMHVKSARLFVWAARKSVLGVYKAWLKQFAAEIDAAKKPKKPATKEFVITP